MSPARRVKQWLGGRFQPSTTARLSAERRARRDQLAPRTPHIRVALIAPVEVRRQLAAAIGQVPDMKIVAGTADRRAAFNFAARTKPDVTVIDADCDGALTGVVIGRRIQKSMPAIGIVLIADDLNLESARDVARDFGTSWSYIHRPRLDESGLVVHVVNSADRSIQWMDPALEESLAEMWRMASEQRDAEEGLKSDPGRPTPFVQTLTVRGYEGGSPRSFDTRSCERYDL
jgi:DNA-binding NarL/FixJ family response regulator